MISNLTKPQRIQNKKLLKEFRSYYCCVQSHKCIAGGDVCFEHWKTKGARGGDTVKNGNPMCVGCHLLKAEMGVESFWEKYGDKINVNRAAQGLPPFDPEKVGE